MIKDDCEPVLAGIHAKQLGIIKFCSNPSTYKPINMIRSNNKEQFQEILQQYPELFNAIGKLKDYKVKLLTDEKIKPVSEPPRRMQYHLVDRVGKALDEMLANDVVEEQPRGEPAPWTSNVVVANKDDMGKSELPWMPKT